MGSGKNKAFALFGTQGAGKSSYARKLIDAGNDRNVIVYCEQVNIEDPVFADYPLVSHGKYKGGRVRFSSMDFQPRKWNGRNVPKERYLSFLLWLNQSGFNGTIAINDATLYEKHETSPEMEYMLTMRRHIGINIMMLFHACGNFPPNLVGNLNYALMFHTTDNFQRKGDSLPKMDLLIAAQEQKEREWFSGDDKLKYKPVILKLS